jgi:hypothetical protein
MTDDELRALVKAAVARHLGRPAAGWSASPPATAAAPATSDASHYVYVTVINAGDACVIEPSVPCDHCGYCKSHGH